MMESSVVVLKGQPNRKLKEEDIPEYALLAGVKFIKLRHITQFGVSPIAVRSFQGVIVTIGQKQHGGLGYSYVTTKDAEGNAAPAQRNLYFNPDYRTGEMLAWCPDTPFNRKKLASAMLSEPFCEILDDDIKAAVKAQSLVIKKNLPKPIDKDVVLSETLDENEELRRTVAKLSQNINDITARNERNDDIRAELKKPKSINVDTPEPPIVSAEDKDLVSDEMVREKVRNTVYNIKSTLVTALKKEHGADWEKSKRYQRQILPEINSRYNAIMENF